MAFVARRRDRPTCQKELDVLRGGDDTEVSESSSSWVLKKTVVFANVSVDKPLQDVVYEEKNNYYSNQYIRLTSQVQGQSEVVEEEHLIDSADYVVKKKTLSQVFAGIAVLLRVYLKSTGSPAVCNNRIARTYGFTRLRFGEI